MTKRINGLCLNFYRASEGGWMYDIYHQELDDIDEDTESIDGGHCTTNLKNAIGMAVEQVMQDLNR